MTGYSGTKPENIRLDEDVLKTSFVFVFRKRLQDALVIRLQKTSSRVLKTSWSRPIYSFGHTSLRRLQDVFKTSSRCLAKTSLRHLQEVLRIYLQDVFKTYHQVKLFLLTLLREVLNTFLRSTAKTVMYRETCLGYATFEKFMAIE